MGVSNQLPLPVALTPLNGRLDGSQSLSGRPEGQTSLLSLPEIELVSLGRSVRSLVHCTVCEAGNDRNC